MEYLPTIPDEKNDRALQAAHDETAAFDSKSQGPPGTVSAWEESKKAVEPPAGRLKSGGEGRKPSSSAVQ